jgi:hypothetical protein
MSKTQLGIVIASRGLMFSRTAEEIERETRGIRRKFYFAHGKPIPKCFESPVNRALCDFDNTHVLIIEEDMKLHQNAVWDALDADEDVVVYDYPITKNGRGSVFSDGTGRVIYSGTGFMLIKREVFDQLKAPYFRSDIGWNVYRDKESLRFVARKMAKGNGYGLHDITFGMKLQKAGINIHVMDKTLGQRKLIELGKSGTNDGAHKIEDWTKVRKDFSLKEYMKLPESLTSKSNLVTLETLDGFINVSKEHADKLIDAEKAKPIQSKQTVIEFGEFKI